MSSRFATTRWSIVLAASDGQGTQSRWALGTLCHAYWYPLYAYARHRGYDPDRARDLTQGFFADLLERRALAGLGSEKGRFRAFLLASMRNFLSHVRDREQAAKRGGGTRTVSIDSKEGERRFSEEPMAGLSPRQLYERRWGLTLMERAMTCLKQAQGEHSVRLQRFAALKPFLTGGHGAAYREVAAELSMSVGAVKVAVHRLRRSYGELLRQEIAATVVDASEVDNELRYLLTTIRPWQA